METYSCRCVEHILPSGSRHLDLFIQVPGQNSLITYEIPEKLLENFFLHFQPLKYFLILSYKLKIETEEEVGEAQPAVIRAFRKDDHRLFYWDYAGKISGNRGYIEERFRTTISGEIHAPEIRIKRGKKG